MDNENPQAALYDFFLLALAWLRQENPDTLERRGASVFAALQYAGAGFHLAQTLALQSWDLAERVRDHSIVYEGDKNPKKRELRRWLAESGKHNVILAVPPASLTPALLFGPNGCHHAITEAGLVYASSITDRYAHIVTREQVLQGWETQRARMSSYHAKRSAAESADRGE